MPKKYVKFGDNINLEKYFKVWGEQVTLHIAIDGIDGLGKTKMTKKLQKYLTQKLYSVTLIT